jgi:hypothetical protein
LRALPAILEGSVRILGWSSLALLGVVAAVCAVPARAQQVEIKPKEKVKRDKYVITQEEIAEHPDLRDGYDVVKVLRNQWLRVTRGSGGALGSTSADPSPSSRPPLRGCEKDPKDPYCTGGSSGGSPMPTERGSPYAESGASGGGISQAGPVLYVDEIKQDRLDDLRSVRAADILEVRYMTGTEASGRYGSGHANGAILVKRKKPGS